MISNYMLNYNLCDYDTPMGIDCVWECSDIPGLFYCKNCDYVRQWNRFAQCYSMYVREKK